jgi:GTP cyclohydrolase I
MSLFEHMSHAEERTDSVSDVFEIPDVQSRSDARRIPIDQVGIRDLLHPVLVSDGSGAPSHTVGRFQMTVGLSASAKGTHMSRFLEILGTQTEPLSVETFETFLRRMIHRLDAHTGRVELRFTHFIEKTAPVSRVRSLLDYGVTFVGEIHAKDGYRFRLQVVVPVTSLCPCSKEISERGAHNQRSHITVTTDLASPVRIAEVARLVEREASCELFGLLKRPDEKWVTERAYDNPKFVEDLVRDVANALAQDGRILGYAVESENFESIHNHSAFARIDRLSC